MVRLFLFIFFYELEYFILKSLGIEMKGEKYINFILCFWKSYKEDESFYYLE